MKAVVAAFNQELALVGAVITNLRMDLFEALVDITLDITTWWPGAEYQWLSSILPPTTVSTARAGESSYVKMNLEVTHYSEKVLSSPRWHLYLLTICSNIVMWTILKCFPTVGKKIKMSNFNSEELLCPVRFPPRSSVLWRTFNGICGKLLTAPGWV